METEQHFNFCLAPMRGVTTVIYRNTFAKHFTGLDAAQSPFIPTVHADKVKPKLLNDVLPGDNRALPLVPQIIGNNPDDFMLMADALAELGYQEINWNLGCPWKHIRKKKRGSGLLQHPELIRAVLDRACAAYPARISVKVRLGVETPDELLSLMPMFNEYPLAEVAIHARTAVQMYEGRVDLDSFEAAAALCRHPVCYNGDINDPEFFNSLRCRFPQLERYMFGRGLLMNPFLCEIIRAGEDRIPDKISRIQYFHRELVAAYRAVLFGDHPVLGKMKELWKYLGAHLDNGEKLFKKIKKAQRVDTALEIADEFLARAHWRREIIWRGDLKLSEREGPEED